MSAAELDRILAGRAVVCADLPEMREIKTNPIAAATIAVPLDTKNPWCFSATEGAGVADNGVTVVKPDDRELADPGRWYAVVGSLTATFGGDLAAVTGTTQKVIGLQQRPLAATAPTTGQFVGWDGSTWKPSSALGAATATSVVASSYIGVGSALPASGALRLDNDTYLVGANTTAGAVPLIGINASDRILVGDGTTTITVNAGAGDLSLTGDIVNLGSGTKPSTGSIRIANAKTVYWASSTGGAIHVLDVDSSNVINLGDAAYYLSLGGVGIVSVSQYLGFQNTVSAPWFGQYNKTSGTGENLLIRAQCTASGTGGDLQLSGGTGTVAAGKVTLSGRDYEPVATPSVAGFQSAADKAKSDLIGYGTLDPVEETGADATGVVKVFDLLPRSIKTTDNGTHRYLWDIGSGTLPANVDAIVLIDFTVHLYGDSTDKVPHGCWKVSATWCRNAGGNLIVIDQSPTVDVGDASVPTLLAGSDSTNDHTAKFSITAPTNATYHWVITTHVECSYFTGSV